MKKMLVVVVLASLCYWGRSQPEINCDTIYADPADSEYILPYSVDQTFTVTQSNCHPTGGHYLTFAYDFNTEIGDTIIACRSGVVTFTNDQYSDTDWTSGHENNVFIKHADETRIRYTHLKQGGALVSANNTVEQGQPIGISGNSGNTGGFPHLHLAAFKDGTSFNRQNTIPLNFCNTNDPVDDQNLLIEGQSYTALEKNTTSILDVEKSANISVFPNPASYKIKISWKASNLNLQQLFLYDAKGVLVHSIDLPHEFNGVEISVQEIPKGLYFLVLKSVKKNMVKKVVVN